MKKLGLFLLGLLIFLTAGILVTWNVIIPPLVGGISRSTILKKLKTIHNLRVNKLGNPVVKRDFPYVIVILPRIWISQNTNLVRAEDISDKVSIFKFLFSKIFSGKMYLGEINIKKLYASLTIKTKDKKHDPLHIPLIPADIHVLQSSIKLKINNTSIGYRGNISLAYNLLNKTNILSLNGTLNTNHTSINATLHRNHVSVELLVKLRKTFHGIKTISGSLTAHLQGKIKLHLKLNAITYKMFSASNVSVDGSIQICRNTLQMENLTLYSENGYNVLLNGNINTSTRSLSNLNGQITTPYLAINQQVLNTIHMIKVERYLKCAEVKVKQLRFSGKFNKNFIKSGTILVKKATLRFKKNDPWINTEYDTIIVSPGEITAHLNGSLGEMQLNNSTVTINRTKGYPCNMILRFSGNLTKEAEIFLKHNIFSKRDIKQLGNPSNLHGTLSGTAKIKNYRWKPHPPFDFHIHIEISKLTLKDNWVPGKHLSVNGNIEVTRLIKNDTVYLYIDMTNFKAESLRSHISTNSTNITLKPELSFNSTFSGKLARADVSYLEESLSHKAIFSPQGPMKISGTINGKPHLLSFNTTAYTAYGNNGRMLPILLKIKGNATNDQITLYNANIAIGNKGGLKATCTLNFKSNNYSGRIQLKNFNLDLLNSLTPVSHISGYLNGKAEFLISKGTIKRINGNVTLSRGAVGNLQLTNISTNIKFSKHEILIQHGTAISSDTPLKYHGEVILTKPRYVTFRANAPLFTLKTTHEEKKLITAKRYPKRTKTPRSKHRTLNPNIYIPAINADILIHFAKFRFISRKDRFVLNDLTFHATKQGGNTKLSLISKETNANITIKQRKNSYIIGKILDRKIFSFLTGNKMKNNILKVNFRLRSKKTKHISLESLYGPIDAEAKHGEFIGVPPVYKILAVTNIVSLLSGKVNFDRKLIYHRITAPLYLRNGVLSTQKDKAVAFEGKSISIFAYGSYNIPKNYADFDVTFITFRTINRLISSIPVVGWIIGGKEKSFTGLSFHVYGHLNGKMHAHPIPFKSVGKGILGIIKRTLTLPFHILK